MADKFQNRYRVPSARAVWHDYDGGMYFITVCTAQHENYFGFISNGEMHFTVVGDFLNEQIQNVRQHYPYAEIPLHVIMPNHVHLVVCIDGDRDNTHAVEDNNKQNLDKKPVANEKMQEISKRKKPLSVVVGGIKSAVTKFANENKITFAWQTRFHDRIIRNQDECNRVADYIETNVDNWNTDMLYRE